jgi:hypothetical protein
MRVGNTFSQFLEFSPQFCRNAIFFPAFDFKYQILFVSLQNKVATLRSTIVAEISENDFVKKSSLVGNFISPSAI